MALAAVTGLTACGNARRCVYSVFMKYNVLREDLNKLFLLRMRFKIQKTHYFLMNYYLGYYYTRHQGGNDGFFVPFFFVEFPPSSFSSSCWNLCLHKMNQEGKEQPKKTSENKQNCYRFNIIFSFFADYTRMNQNFWL